MCPSESSAELADLFEASDMGEPNISHAKSAIGAARMHGMTTFSSQ
jgi:hypothetical protein